MDPTLGQWIVALSQNLLASFIGVLLGLAFAHFYQERRERQKYGGWHVLVFKDGEEKVNRAIPVAKAKEIPLETPELSVFLKGVASPYGWINCDLIVKGKELGLLKIDNPQRRIVINLDCNPKPPRETSNADLLEALKQIAAHLDMTITVPAPAGAQPVREGV
jgi:hypothetical protein